MQAYLKKCLICKGTHLTPINTYKHLWHSCNDCGNIIRQQKAKYLLDFIPDALFKYIPKGTTLAAFLKKKTSGKEFYDCYLDSNSEQKPSKKGTKWEHELSQLTQILHKVNIDLHNKSILDLSGGPGFLAQDLSTICRNVVVTEYSNGSVARMKKLLNLNALKFDYETDDLDKMIHEKFDLVLIRYSINFCTNIPKLLASLKNLLNKDAIVYVSFIPPTLGTCLRWQFDDYTYLILYHPDTMIQMFMEQGFSLLARDEEESYYYLQGRVFKCLSPLILPYTFINKFKKCNQELIQKNTIMIFKVNN